MNTSFCVVCVGSERKWRGVTSYTVHTRLPCQPGPSHSFLVFFNVTHPRSKRLHHPLSTLYLWRPYPIPPSLISHLSPSQLKNSSTTDKSRRQNEKWEMRNEWWGVRIKPFFSKTKDHTWIYVNVTIWTVLLIQTSLWKTPKSSYDMMCWRDTHSIQDQSSKLKEREEKRKRKKKNLQKRVYNS